MAAGMGGGSTDAATALLVGAEVLREAGGPDVSAADLHKLARALGADVPFFLDPRPAIGRGIGDLLEPLPLPELPLVLIFTDQPLSTAHVYREFDVRNPVEDVGRLRRALRGRGGEVAQGEDRRGRGQVSLTTTWRRPAATCCPGLCDAKDIILQEGALGALMSGSGPTVYGVCASLDGCRGALREGVWRTG